MTATTMLNAIDLAIAGIIARRSSAWTVAGVTYSSHNLNDLRQLREYYAEEAAKAAATAAGRPGFAVGTLRAGDGK